MLGIRRREFISLIGGATAWPIAARAQTERMRRVGGLVAGAEDLPSTQATAAVVREGLRQLGWIEGRNIRIDYRFAAGPDSLRSAAAELVGLEPDVLVANGAAPLAALRGMTRTIPIVFGNVSDPVGNGFVTSVAHPGGNITGFASYEQTISVKWLELLKEIAPRVTRATFLHDPLNPISSGYWREMERSAPAFGVRVSAAPVASAAEIERAIADVAREPNSGLVVLGGAAIGVHSELIITLAARHQLPAVYALRYFVVAGGLAFYGIHELELHRSTTIYVDRILKGEKPGDLPVQFATKFELVINLKTAKALGLDPPISLLARTDEVIE
jgi:putative ABC transport system substrate-binding protein